MVSVVGRHAPILRLTAYKIPEPHASALCHHDGGGGDEGGGLGPQATGAERNGRIAGLLCGTDFLVRKPAFRTDQDTKTPG